MQPNNSSEIFHTGYEKWEGDREVATPAWALIGYAGLKNVVASSGCFGRFFFIVFLVIYYFLVALVTITRHQLPNLKNLDVVGSILTPFGEFFAGYDEAFVHAATLWPAIIFMALAMVFYGSQLIAKDRAANALQVYFSKSISMKDYVIGKFLSVSVLTAIVTLVPSAMMIGLGLVVNTGFVAFLKDAWLVPLSAVAVWAFLTFCFGAFALFFSSCFSKTYMASVSFLGFMFISSVGSLILRLMFGSVEFIEGIAWFSSMHDVGEAIFTLEAISSATLFWQFFDLALVCSFFVVLLVRNVRPVEVVN